MKTITIIKINAVILLLLVLNAIITPLLIPVIAEKYAYSLSNFYRVIYASAVFGIIILLIYNISLVIKAIKNKGQDRKISAIAVLMILVCAILYYNCQAHLTRTISTFPLYGYSTKSKGFENNKYYLEVKNDIESIKIFCSEQVYELIDTNTDYYIHITKFGDEYYLNKIYIIPEDAVAQMGLLLKSERSGILPDRFSYLNTASIFLRFSRVFSITLSASLSFKVLSCERRTME